MTELLFPPGKAKGKGQTRQGHVTRAQGLSDVALGHRKVSDFHPQRHIWKCDQRLQLKAPQGGTCDTFTRFSLAKPKCASAHERGSTCAPPTAGCADEQPLDRRGAQPARHLYSTTCQKRFPFFCSLQLPRGCDGWPPNNSNLHEVYSRTAPHSVTSAGTRCHKSCLRFSSFLRRCQRVTSGDEEQIDANASCRDKLT